jgi:pimeloyl-ACP methyl ester carboxylesterase
MHSRCTRSTCPAWDGQTSQAAEADLRSAVVEFATALNLENVTLAGESMGATLALSASVELGDRVSRVVALYTYDYPEGLARGNRFAKLIITGVRLPLFGPVFARSENRFILKGVMRGGLVNNKKLLEPFLTELRRVGRRRGYPRVARAILRNLDSLIATRKRYPLVRVPVVLVYSDNDWSRPADRQGVEDLLRVKAITLPHTGHFSALERPAEVAQILLDARRL